MKRKLTKFAAALTALTLAVAAIPSELVAFAAEENPPARGDVNLDGVIDKADIAAMEKLLSSSAATIFAEEAENNTAYDITLEGLIDSRDLYALTRYVNEKEAFPMEYSKVTENPVSLRISDGECFSGSTVTLDVGFVDWTKDIAGYDVVLRFDDCFTVSSVSCTGSGMFATEGTALKLCGNYTDKEEWRGNIASVTLKSKEKFSGDAKVAIESANVFNSEYDFYTPKLDTSSIEVHDVFAPVGLQQAGISSGSAKISWEMPFTDQPIASYSVYRDGEEIGQVSAEEFSFLDTGLTLGTEYSYTVKANLDTGVQSDASRPLVVTPQLLKLKSAAFSTEQVNVLESDLTAILEQPIMLESMTMSVKDSAGKVKDVKVPLEGASLAQITSKLDVTAYITGEYTMTVTVQDVDGKTDSTSFLFDIFTTPPEAVKLEGYAGELNATLTWDIAVEASACGYRVYRQAAGEKEWTLVKEIKDRSVLSYQDTKLTAGSAYNYAVTVFNEFGTESEKSNTVTVTPKADVTPPEITYFIPKDATRVAGLLQVSVKAADSGNIEKVYCEISTDKGETWTELFTQESDNAVWKLDTTTYEDGIYYLRAMAKDAAGLESSGVNQVAIEIDNTAPEQVTGVKADVVYPTQATISWNGVKDEDCAYFLVTLTHDGKTEQKRSNAKGINLTGLIQNTAYILTVCAVDQLGNMGASSEPLRFTTVKDTGAPVITQMRLYGDVIRAGGVLNVYVVAKDNENGAISAIYLQYSQDMKTWRTLSLNQYYGTFNVSDTNLKDGTLYLRAYAIDVYGNCGDPEKATVEEVTVDNTPPKEIPLLSSKVLDNGIQLSWTKQENSEIVGFGLQRAEKADGTYTSLLQNASNLSYTDTKANPNVTYYYRICGYDKAGNQGAYSEPLAVKFSPDVIAPVLQSFYLSPQNQIISDYYSSLQVIATDNLKMADIILEYQCDAETAWTAFTGTNEFNSDSKQLKVTADIPAAVMKAENVRIRITPKDAYGNSPEPSVYNFTVDNRMANITAFTAKRDGNAIAIDWALEDVSIVRSMNLLRKVDDGKEYTLVYQAPKAEQLEYSYKDSRLENSGSYVYRLEIICTNGNVVSKTLEPMKVQSVPVPMLVCETTQKLGAAYRFDATGSKNADEITMVTLDFGDETCKTSEDVATAVFEHTYAAVGEYTVTLTCTNADGFSASVTAVVRVEEPASIAQVTVTVTDTAGSAAANTSIYLDVGTDSQVKYQTDGNGKVTFFTTAGNHEIGVFGNGYLPATKLCECIAGADNQISFSVVKNQLVEASFKITKMTFDEIKAAGINVASPENCHVEKIDVTLSYVSDKSNSNKLTIYYDSKTGTNYLPESAKKQGYQIGKIVTNQKREINTIVLLHIPAEVQFLKEFFNVEMIIINNADAGFTIENSEVTLNLPNGLTLMESANGSSPRTVYIGDLVGGKQPETVNWIVRGDTQGDYQITADFSGKLTKFNEDIHQTFVSEQSIHVNGLSAVDITLNIGSSIFHDRLYAELVVKNNSSSPIYALSTNIGEILATSLGKFIGNPKVSIAQTRFKGKDNIWLVKDEKTDYIEELKSGETFSVLYAITDFSDEYAFTFLKYVKDSLQASSTFGRAKVNVTSVSPIDTDSLYYGIDFDEKTDYMIVVRNKARRAISGATVKLYEVPNRYYYGSNKTLVAQGTTDSRGRLIIPRGDSAKYYVLTAECEGYRTYMDSTFGFTSSTANHQSTITMSAILETGSYKLSAAKIYVDDRYAADVLNNSYTVMEGDTGSFILAVTSSADTTKFEVYQGTRRIASANAEEGYAEISLRNTSFDYGKSCYVHAFAPSGDDISTKINIQVVKKPVDVKKDIDNAINQTVGETGSISTPTPQVLLDYGWCLDLNIKFPDTVKSASNLVVSDDSINTYGKNKFTMTNDEISFYYTLNFVDEKPVDKKEIKIGWLGSLGIAIGFYFGGKIDINANKIELTGGVVCEVSGSLSGILGEWVTPPCYIGVTISASVRISALVNFMVSMDTGAFSFDYFELGGKLRVQFELDAMLGVKGIVAGGVYGHLDFVLDSCILRTNGDPYFKEIYLSGDAGLRGEFLGFEGKVKMIEGKIVFIKNDGSRAIVPKRYTTPAQALADPSYYAFDNVAAGTNIWNGKLTESAAETVLRTDVYTGCSPVLASDGKTTIMAWVENDATRGAGNAKHVVYSIYNSETATWSEPLAVDDNMNAEYNPVLYVAKDGIYLAYQESETVFDGENTMELTEYAAQMDLMTTKFDADSKKFAAADTLVKADGKTFSCAPEFISDAEGNLYVFWQCNKNGTIFANDNANAILCAQMTDKGWSKPTELAADLPMLSDFACGLDANGKPVCAYLINPDTDPLKLESRELYLQPMDGEAKLLRTGMIESLDCTEICGKTEKGFVWLENGCFYSCTDGENAELLMDASALHPTGDLIMADDRAFFTGYADEGNTLYTATYDGEAKTFSTPVVYKNAENTYYQNLQAAKVGNDVLLIASRETASVSEEDFTVNASLIGEKFTKYTNLSLTGCDYAVSNAASAKEFPMNMQIQNNGSERVSQVKVSLLDANGQAAAEKTYTVDLASGAATEIEFAPVLPADFVGAAYNVTIAAVGAKELTMDDNTAKVDLTKTDLRVNAAKEYDEDKTFVTLTVTNDSCVPASAMLKAIPHSTGEATVALYSDVIEPHKSVFWTIDAEELLGDVFHDFVEIEIESDVEDADLENNSGTLTLTKGGMDGYQMGDINFDGGVNERDAVLVLTMYVRSMFADEEGRTSDSFSVNQHMAADVNGDGMISEYDATLLLTYYAYTITLDEGEEVLSLSEYLESKLNGGSNQ